MSPILPPASELEVAARLAVASLAGLAVGIEREWSGHASGPDSRFAGARTFLLLGFLGGAAGWLFVVGLFAPAVILLSGGVILTVAAYIMAARRGGDAVDGTTEAAALVTLAVATAAGLGELRLASAATALMVLALAEKSTVQGFIQRIGRSEMQAALQFLVLALVILPLLPEGPYGPLGGIRPRELWLVVLLFSGLNFAGYVARRAVGEARGYGVSGLLGGLVSSTAVTLTFARQSREEPALGSPLALGVIAACTVLVPRVALITGLLSPPVARLLIVHLLPAFLIGGVYVAAILVRHPAAAKRARTRPAEAPTPLRLWSAVRMALLFQVVLMAIDVVRTRWGTAGIFASSAFLGLTDVDALTLSMSRYGAETGAALEAAQAITIGMFANTILKLALATGLGSGSFRRVALPGLVILGGALGVGFWLGRLAG